MTLHSGKVLPFFFFFFVFSEQLMAKSSMMAK